MYRCTFTPTCYSIYRVA